MSICCCWYGGRPIGWMYSPANRAMCSVPMRRLAPTWSRSAGRGTSKNDYLLSGRGLRGGNRCISRARQLVAGNADVLGGGETVGGQAHRVGDEAPRGGL